MKKNIQFVVGGKEININSLDATMDEAFISLYSAYYGHQTCNLSKFDTASRQFFTQYHDANASLHDAYFENFTMLWNTFLTAGNYDEAERIWNLALSSSLAWEKENPNKFIHKGTAYYFWGMTALIRGDLDKGYILMHRGVEEDIRTTGKNIPDTAGYALVSLNYENINQAFYKWVVDQVRFLNEKQNCYSSLYGRTFILDDFKKKFLSSPPNTAVSFLFAYVVARLMRMSSLPVHTLQSAFSAQVEANLLFDLLLVIDATIRFKNKKGDKFISHAAYLTNRIGKPLTIKQLKNINSAFQKDINGTLTDMIACSYVLDGHTITKLHADIAIAYGLRNYGAHDISSVPIVSDKYVEIEQSLFNVLFLAVDYLY